MRVVIGLDLDSVSYRGYGNNLKEAKKDLCNMLQEDNIEMTKELVDSLELKTGDANKVV